MKEYCIVRAALVHAPPTQSSALFSVSPLSKKVNVSDKAAPTLHSLFHC